MAKAYYGDRISENMTKTPEGFLICHNVPIARTGSQEYPPDELDLDRAEFPGFVSVYRTEEEVFEPLAIASFEGKAVTSPHPPEFIHPENYAMHAKGFAVNVRRGKKDKTDCLLADLTITDPNLISEIENGKRGISCGYNYSCKIGEDGKFYQKNIRGNHIAVVGSGRAGDRIAICDEKPKELIEKEKSKMGFQKKKPGFAANFFKFLAANDAEPEQFEEAAKMLTSDSEPESEPKKTEDEGDSALAQILSEIKSLRMEVEQLKAGKPEEKSSLDELEAELTGVDSDPDEAKTLSPDNKEDTPKSSASDSMILGLINQMKPIVAGLPEGERKKANDAMSRALREARGAVSTQKASYADLMQMKANDSKKMNTAEATQAYIAACEKQNPHNREAR